MVKKPKGKKNESPKQSPEESFLRSLGLKSLLKETVYDAKYFKLLETAGGNPNLEVDDAFSPEAMDQYFLTEELARRTLSGDYERILKTLKAFSSFSNLPANPQKISDIGGGCGVYSMWLAKSHPKASLVVYDRSKNSLKIGALWAEKLGLNNIQFCHATYDDLASAEGTHDSDIAFVAEGLDTDISPEKEDDVYFFNTAPADLYEKYSERFRPIASACSNLLKPEGVGIFIGPCSEWGYVCLFGEMRKSGFGVDWESTYARGKAEEANTHITDSFVFFRKGIPNILGSNLEDARALATCAKYYGEIYEIGNAELESYAGLFSDGTELARFEFEYKTGGRELVRVLLKAGLILMIHTTTLGYRRGLLHSAAAVMELLNHAFQILNDRSKTDAVQVKTEKLHPQVEQLLSCYAEHDTEPSSRI